MYMNKFHKNSLWQSFFFLVRNYSKFCHTLLDHSIMKNTVCSKTPSYCDAFSPVSSMYINKFHDISQRQSFFIETILSPATLFWIFGSWRILYAVKLLHIVMAFSPVSSMYNNKFHEICQRQSFFMENPVCSKSSSYISTFSQVSTM